MVLLDVTQSAKFRGHERSYRMRVACPFDVRQLARAWRVCKLQQRRGVGGGINCSVARCNLEVVHVDSIAILLRVRAPKPQSCILWDRHGGYESAAEARVLYYADTRVRRKDHVFLFLRDGLGQSSNLKSLHSVWSIRLATFRRKRSVSSLIRLHVIPIWRAGLACCPF